MENPHPQATTATGSGLTGLLGVWLLGRYGVNLNSEEGLLIGGALTSLVLLVGRKGLRGIIGSIWRGGG